MLIAGTAAAVAEDRPVWYLGYPLAPSHPVVAQGWPLLRDALASDIDLHLRLNGPALSDAGSLDALATGRHQIGMTSLSSHPGIFPYWGLLGELFMVGRGGLPAAAAISELVMLHCRPCQANLARRKLVFLGTYAASPFGVLAPGPLTQAHSLEGRKVATPGSLWDRLVLSLGGQAVVPEGDAKQAFARGEVTTLIDIPSALLHPEIAGHAVVLTAMPLGSYRGGSPFTVNRNAWRGLSDEQRTRLFKAAAAAIVRISAEYQSYETTVLAVAESRGAETATAGPLLEGRIQRFAAEDAEWVVRHAAERFGVRDARPFTDRLRKLHDKYAILLGPDVGQDDAIALLQAEIFDRLNPKVYGLE